MIGAIMKKSPVAFYVCSYRGQRDINKPLTNLFSIFRIYGALHGSESDTGVPELLDVTASSSNTPMQRIGCATTE